jgi:hypothetical protein
MNKYEVKYYYLATGMEGRADDRIIGTFEAENKEEAIELAIKQEIPVEEYYGPDNKWKTSDWLRSCLSAKQVYK